MAVSGGDMRRSHLDEAWKLALTPSEEDVDDHIRWLLREYDPFLVVYAMASVTCALTGFMRGVKADPELLARLAVESYRPDPDPLEHLLNGDNR